MTQPFCQVITRIMLAVVEDIGYSIRKLEIGILSSPKNDRTYYDLVKQLSHYLYFFSFYFSFGLTIQERSAEKCHKEEQQRRIRIPQFNNQWSTRIEHFKYRDRRGIRELCTETSFYISKCLDNLLKVEANHSKEQWNQECTNNLSRY